MACDAQRVNDEMQCGRCGLAWAIDDNDPPRCKPHVTPAGHAKSAQRVGDATYMLASGSVDAIPRMPNDRRFTAMVVTTTAASRKQTALARKIERRRVSVPVETERRAVDRLPSPDDLPASVINEMNTAFVTQGRTAAEGMRAAYRVLLDRLGE